MKRSKSACLIFLFCFWWPLFLSSAYSQTQDTIIAYHNSKSYDARHYSIEVELLPDSQKVKAEVVLTIERKDDKDPALQFLLHGDASLNSVEADGLPLKFTHIRDSKSPLGEGGELGLDGAFVRIEDPIKLFSVSNKMTLTFTYELKIRCFEKSWCLLRQAERWYPYRYDDLATGELTIITPGHITAVSNGQLRYKNSDGEKTYHTWSITEPIDYFGVAAGPYYERQFLEDGVPIICYLIPEDSVFVDQLHKKAKDVLAFYSESFGEYPFPKFAVAELPKEVAPFCQSLSSVLLAGEFFVKSLAKRWDWWIYHEIAHQWWGNSIFVEEDPGNIWLEEGLAEYSYLLFAEASNGAKRLKWELEKKQEKYLAVIANETDIPIAQISFPRGKSEAAVVYQKGPYVFHMLRYVMGDSAFHHVLKEFAGTFSHRQAQLGDFVEIAEGVCGERLDWFFDEWLRREGLPVYAYGFGFDRLDSDKHRVVVHIEQQGEIFKMPLEISILTAEEELCRKVFVDSREGNFTFTLSSPPLECVLNKNKTVLCRTYLKD